MSEQQNPVIQSTPHKVMAIVLSGGAGRRFDGLDKGLQVYDKLSMVEKILATLEPQVDAAVVSINRNLDEYEKITDILVFDHDAEYQGPLAGVTAALSYLENLNDNNIECFSHFLICPCDTPLLPKDYAARLMAALEDNELSIAVAHDGQRRQNLHCLIPKQSIQSLQDFYQSGGRAMHRWQKIEDSKDVDFSDQADCFLNINKPEQLK